MELAELMQCKDHVLRVLLQDLSDCFDWDEVIENMVAEYSGSVMYGILREENCREIPTCFSSTRSREHVKKELSWLTVV